MSNSSAMPKLENPNPDVRLRTWIGVFGRMLELTGYEQLQISQIVREFGQPSIMLPLSSIATYGIEKEQAGSASGLFNMMRNLGGSLGIAVLGTLLARREQFQSNHLADNISLYNPETQEGINQLTQIFISKGADLTTAQNQALAAIGNTMRREASQNI